jgi:hypothetical protein
MLLSGLHVEHDPTATVHPDPPHRTFSCLSDFQSAIAALICDGDEQRTDTR